MNPFSTSSRLGFQACGINISRLLTERPDNDPTTRQKPITITLNIDKPCPPLPYDIVCYLLLFLPDFYTLRILLLSGRAFYDAFSSHRERVLEQILCNQFGLGAGGALRLATLLLDDKKKKPSIKNGNEWLAAYQPEYTAQVLKQTKWIHKITHAYLLLYLTRSYWLFADVSTPPYVLSVSRPSKH